MIKIQYNDYVLGGLNNLLHVNKNKENNNSITELQVITPIGKTLIASIYLSDEGVDELVAQLMLGRTMNDNYFEVVSEDPADPYTIYSS